MRDRKIAKEILDIDFKDGDTLEELNKTFHALMKKYNIKQSSPVRRKGVIVSYTCDNYEWTLYRTLFESKLNSYLIWYNFTRDHSEDL